MKSVNIVHSRKSRLKYIFEHSNTQILSAKNEQKDNAKQRLNNNVIFLIIIILGYIALCDASSMFLISQESIKTAKCCTWMVHFMATHDHLAWNVIGIKCWRPGRWFDPPNVKKYYIRICKWTNVSNWKKQIGKNTQKSICVPNKIPYFSSNQFSSSVNVISFSWCKCKSHRGINVFGTFEGL